MFSQNPTPNPESRRRDHSHHIRIEDTLPPQIDRPGIYRRVISALLKKTQELRYIPSLVLAVRLLSSLLHKHSVLVDIQVDGLYQPVVEPSAPGSSLMSARSRDERTHSVCFSVDVRPK